MFEFMRYSYLFMKHDLKKKFNKRVERNKLIARLSSTDLIQNKLIYSFYKKFLKFLKIFIISSFDSL
jgi:hypothetical protein